MNAPLPAGNFAVPNLNGLSPAPPEPLEANYTNRFIHLRDGSDGRMSLRWGMVERQRKDLVPGDEVSVLLNERTGEGLLELDLPGGTTFANFQGTQPIDPKVFLRILVVPVLALAPLLGLVPSVAVTLHHLAASRESWLVCGWSVVVQIIWMFANRRYFTFKATNIGRGGAKQTGTETVRPARPAGESRTAPGYRRPS